MLSEACKLRLSNHGGVFVRGETHNKSDSVPYLNDWNDRPKLNYNRDDNANPNYGSVVAIVSFEFLKYLNQPNFNQSLQSYLGYLSHANSYRLTNKLISSVRFWHFQH